jgi:hypothetical protein
MRILGAIAICLLLPAAAAQAEDRLDDDDRYVISEVDGGILRVDRLTGQVSLCSGVGGGWSCELVPDDRDALEQEIQAARRENRVLRRQHGEGSDFDRPQRYGRHEPLDPLDEPSGFMSREEVDDALNTLEYMMGRFMGTAERLRKQAPPPR